MTVVDTAELLCMFHVIQTAKYAVQNFENGEISGQEAVRLIKEATAALPVA